MAEPMPGYVFARWEDGDLCPPTLNEILRRKWGKKPPKGPDPDPPPEWRVYDEYYLTLVIHQLSSQLADKSLAKQLQKITAESLKGQLGHLA